MISSRFCGVLLALSLFVACASPNTARPDIQSTAVAAEQERMTLYALEYRARDYARVYNIGERLRIANADLCPEREQAFGLQLETINDYPREMRPAAQSLWGLSEQPSVIWVGPGSPAEGADLRLRDQIVSVNGRAVSANRRAGRDTARAIRRAAQAGSVSLGIRRGPETLEVMLTPVVRCGYDFYVSDEPGVNAFADGELIAVQRDMLRFVQNDNELALVLGHELAHNSHHHVQKMQQNAMVGSIGGAIFDVLLTVATGVNTGGAFSQAGSDAGAIMFSQDFESEADYVGMYYLVRAGYSPDGVADFWRRMAADNPEGVRFAHSHPNHAERFLTLEATRQEIALKITAGAPLIPNAENAAPAGLPQ